MVSNYAVARKRNAYNFYLFYYYTSFFTLDVRLDIPLQSKTNKELKHVLMEENWVMLVSKYVKCDKQM